MHNKVTANQVTLRLLRQNDSAIMIKHLKWENVKYHEKFIVILTFKKFQIKVPSLHDSSRQREAYSSCWL